MQAADKQTEADSSHSLLGSQQPQEASRARAGTSPSLSLGQRMKKCQASWRPLPLSACPLNLPAPSGAAYPLPPPAKQAAAFPLPQQAAVCCPPQQARSATATDSHHPVMLSQHPCIARQQAIVCSRTTPALAAMPMHCMLGWDRSCYHSLVGPLLLSLPIFFVKPAFCCTFCQHTIGNNAATPGSPVT